MSRACPKKRHSGDKPFDVRGGRIMVSLGPLSAGRYCPYSCRFCYLSGDFRPYAALTVDKIASWVATVRDPYDIIYVSYDTDSFAPPRQQRGIELLDRLCEFDVDLLFTTRAVFSELMIVRLASIAQRLATRHRMLVACQSLVQLSVPHLEPPPIPCPDSRIAQLSQLRAAGLATVLTLRPFLPNVPFDDLRQIIERAAPDVEVVLGGVWYYDQAGVMAEAALGAESRSLRPDAIRRMDFDDNEAEWCVFEGRRPAKVVRETCSEHGLPFFMRSGPAVSWLRSRRAAAVESGCRPLGDTATR